MLFGYDFGGRPGRRIIPVVGRTTEVADMKGADRVKFARSPLGGSHLLSAHQHRTGITFGVDVALPLGRQRTLVLPARISKFASSALPGISSPVEQWLGSLTLEAGVGVRFRGLQRAR